jgi:hypothetical protein
MNMNMDDDGVPARKSLKAFEYLAGSGNVGGGLLGILKIARIGCTSACGG